MNLNKNIKIGIVSIVHGDEVIGKNVCNALKKKYYEVEFIEANKEAFRQNKRYVDVDLNRCFPGKKEGNHEEKIAYQLCQDLKKFDLIIDIHSTKAKTEPFAILTNLNFDLMQVIKNSILEKVCIMCNEVASGKALIDFCDGFSVEVNENMSVEECTDIIESIINQTGKKNLEVFQVFEVVKEKMSNLKNFELHESGFYPVLYGEPDYDFECLASRKL
jgi:hypothetical protein